MRECRGTYYFIADEIKEELYRLYGSFNKETYRDFIRYEKQYVYTNPQILLPTLKINLIDFFQNILPAEHSYSG